MRPGEAVPVITGGPTLAVTTILIIPDLIREMGKVPSAVTAAAGKGHTNVVARPPANGQSTTVQVLPGHSGVPAHTLLGCRDVHSLLQGPESVVAKAGVTLEGRL